MSLHMKRLAAPRAWHIKKKQAVWVLKPLPGAHGEEESVPLGVVLRDYLGLVDRMGEARRIIGNRDVLVDGKPAFSPKQAVGFMDVISIPKNEEQYRVVFDTHGRLIVHPISAAASSWKLCRVENKTTVPGGKTQVNLHDGRNILVKEAGLYKTGDTLKVHVPDQKVMGHFPLGENHVAVITGGAHIGQVATVRDVQVTRGPQENLVTLQAGGEPFSTIKPYVFVVGKDKSEVSLPTAGGV